MLRCRLYNGVEYFQDVVNNNLKILEDQNKEIVDIKFCVDGSSYTAMIIYK
jgi:hypothetical protein